MSSLPREPLTLYRSPAPQRRRARPRPARRRASPWPLLLAGLLLFFSGFLLGWAVAMTTNPASQRSSVEDPADPAGPAVSVPGAVPAAPAAVRVPDWVTVDLLPINEYSRPGDALTQIDGVVVHYVGNPGTTARQNRSYFGYLADTHETYASSHFLVGMDGEVIQCVPLDEIAYCSGSRNADTVSIECCHPDDTGEFTQATEDSLKKLLAWLVEAYGLRREDILRHYDVTGKECPAYYVSHPETWEALLDSLTFLPAAPVVVAPVSSVSALGASGVGDRNPTPGDQGSRCPEGSPGNL